MLSFPYIDCCSCTPLPGFRGGPGMLAMTGQPTQEISAPGMEGYISELCCCPVMFSPWTEFFFFFSVIKFMPGLPGCLVRFTCTVLG